MVKLVNKEKHEKTDEFYREKSIAITIASYKLLLIEKNCISHKNPDLRRYKTRRYVFS